MSHPATLADQSLTLRVEAEQVARLYQEHVSIGAPSILRDADTVQLLLASLADGNYRETACKVAGIAKGTLYNLLKRADAGDKAAIAFVDALEKAEAQAEASIVQNVRNAAKSPQFWAAGMTLLERKSPDRWGRRQDDSSSPKVIVQIGASGSDVTVQIGGESSPCPTPLVPAIDVTTSDGVCHLTQGTLSDAEPRRRKDTRGSVPAQKDPTRSRRANRAGGPNPAAEAPAPTQGGVK